MLRDENMAQPPNRMDLELVVSRELCHTFGWVRNFGRVQNEITGLEKDPSQFLGSFDYKFYSIEYFNRVQKY